MKRSEMVNKLADVIDASVVMEENDILDLAEACLKCVEKNGMLPPLYNQMEGNHSWRYESKVQYNHKRSCIPSDLGWDCDPDCPIRKSHEDSI